MSYKRVANWRNRTKTVLVECLGGGCNRCGYRTCLACLDFHHLGDKDMSISRMLTCPTKLDRIVAEAKKCILLCKNCHQELHYNVWNISEIIMQRFDDNKIEESKRKHIPLCQFCGVTPVSNSRYKFCGNVCREAHRRKKIPSLQELESMLWSLPTTHIAKRYEVSDKAVEKWAKKYGLSKPPRGYWATLRTTTPTDK